MIFTMKVIFLDYQILMLFFFWYIRKRNERSHGKRTNRNIKHRNRHSLTLSDLSSYYSNLAALLHFLVLMYLSISSLPNLDIEAYKFYNRDAVILTRCYTQNALRSYID